MKRHLLLYLGVAGLLLLLWGCGTTPASQVNAQAPNFALKDIETSKPINLSAYKGKVVVLDFWATWCPPCREEIPKFVQLYNQYKDKNLVVLGVSMDDTPEPVKPFMQEFHMNYPVAMGNDAVQQSYGGIEGIPTTFIIDKNGKIAAKYVGFQDVDTLKEKILQLL